MPGKKRENERDGATSIHDGGELQEETKESTIKVIKVTEKGDAARR